jgi:hypothetical protein
MKSGIHRQGSREELITKSTPCYEPKNIEPGTPKEEGAERFASHHQDLIQTESVAWLLVPN